VHAKEDVVLVVEDEEEARTSLVELIKLEGMKVLGFENGKVALDYLRMSDELPCLIVMDIRMPVMDGRQLRKVLLEDPKLSDIPIIVVTALDPAAARGLSATRVFRKPVDIDALVQVVRENC